MLGRLLPPGFLVKTLVIVSLCLYLGSVPMTAFILNQTSRVPGYVPLLLGTITFPTSSAHAAWVANPLLLCAWIFLLARLEKLALLSSIAALAVALSFMVSDQHVLVSESGAMGTVTGYDTGYFLWLASMVAAVLAAFSRLQAGRPGPPAMP